ncbi:polysaccharide biosynthesis protein [Halovulum dunhuangense]|uniref:Polysaccharide biosynthesis protein n=1 Tax=Halovulum dunhuangense TaxID=1505036 RepID=A0A849KVH5_9RHOB|nr:nucleoside-diphosphate sugar epimerase/dehydratase [Halovulum dunhuangense]NNU79075.1 polysaccharide biosynthesis protein [Halovulum dunhuangense]
MEQLHDTMTRTQKAIFLLSLDGLAMLVALLVALQLRLGEVWPDRYFEQGFGLFVLVPVIGMLVSWIMGVPRIVLRSFEQRALLRLVQFAFVMSLVTAALNTGLGFGLPRSVPGIWAGVFLLFAVFSRLVLLSLIDRLRARASTAKPVLVYGAGSAGQQLVAALRSSRELVPVGFLDDNPALRRVEVAGLRVHLPADLPRLRAALGIEQVILAMPSLSATERRRKLRALAETGIEVQALPPIIELLDGRSLRDQIRPVSPDELLGREAVDLASPEVTAAYAGRTILVSGAGGSIGSELARQILAARPARLILYELGEFALYNIELELRALGPALPEIVPVLGSVTDPRRVADTIRRYGVDIILHAAAYKHVPLVEANPLEGARNNILGTRTLAEAAAAAGVERFILVSTDKAVRPTSVMGATKRMAELVIQDLQTRHPGTRFAMVRFGNVLGSSGSVIPLFRSQIASGGPVTLTHPEVTRFFMTIPEAAQLVLLAGSYAEGGDVFVLDMGRPVRIADLARSLIELSGLTVRDAANPDGDIEIRVTGLRPGEKLYEELLIDETTIPTPHPRILRASERRLEAEPMRQLLTRIESAIAEDDAAALQNALADAVDGFATGPAPRKRA